MVRLSDLNSITVTDGASNRADSNITHAVIYNTEGVGLAELNTATGAELTTTIGGELSGGNIEGVPKDYDTEAKFVFLYQIEGTHENSAIGEFYVPNPSGLLPSSMGY